MHPGSILEIRLLGYFKYLVTSISRLLKRHINLLMQLYSNYQLALYEQGLNRSSTLTHLVHMLDKAPFCRSYPSPCLKAGVSRRSR